MHSSQSSSHPSYHSYINHTLLKSTDWKNILVTSVILAFIYIALVLVIPFIPFESPQPLNPIIIVIQGILVILVTLVTLVTQVILVTPVTLVLPVIPVNLDILVTLVILVILVTPVTLLLPVIPINLDQADKGWVVKLARLSKKVWCSGLGLCLFSLVFDFGQRLRCGLSIRHCRCHWIMAPWLVFLHFFLVALCWYAVSERQMLLFFAGGLVGVDKHLFQRVSFITWHCCVTFEI